MKRYVALLRGINVSGKNKIAMSDLKKAVEELGFLEVVTCLNSGNVIFSSEAAEKNLLSDQIVTMIKGRFNLTIPVLVILQEELEDILSHAPDWFGNDNKEIYDNVIFLMPPLTYEELLDTIGAPEENYEKVCHYKEVVYWSFVRKDYQKTNWWSKTANANVSEKITIRTVNTVRKIALM